MSAPLVVEATAPDHPDALALIAGSEAELASLYKPEQRFAFSPEQLVASGTVFVVARREGAPFGCGGVAPLDGYGELKRIYVAPAARGTGVAKAVIRRLEEIARDRGLPVMRLETGVASLEAIGLYESLGYARRGPFGAYAENGSSVFMEKALG